MKEICNRDGAEKVEKIIESISILQPGELLILLETVRFKAIQTRTIKPDNNQWTEKQKPETPRPRIWSRPWQQQNVPKMMFDLSHALCG